MLLLCDTINAILFRPLSSFTRFACKSRRGEVTAEQTTGNLLFSISEIFHKTFTIKRLTIDKIRNIMKSQIGEKLICKTKINIRQNRREAVTQSQGTFFKKVRPVAIRIE